VEKSSIEKFGIGKDPITNGGSKMTKGGKNGKRVSPAKGDIKG